MNSLHTEGGHKLHQITGLQSYSQVLTGPAWSGGTESISHLHATSQLSSGQEPTALPHQAAPPKLHLQFGGDRCHHAQQGTL